MYYSSAMYVCMYYKCIPDDERRLDRTFLWRSMVGPDVGNCRASPRRTPPLYHLVDGGRGRGKREGERRERGREERERRERGKGQ